MHALGNQVQSGQEAEDHGGDEAERKYFRMAFVAEAQVNLHGLAVSPNESVVEIEEGSGVLGCHWCHWCLSGNRGLS
jgi:hypothetical protein